MNRLAIVGVLAACSKPDQPPPPREPPPGEPGAALGVLAELPGEAQLIAGTRRVAVIAGERWLEPARSALVERPLLAAALAGARTRLGPLVELHLGTFPVIVGGEDHREEHLRLGPEPRPIAADGILVELATAGPDREIWLVEHELRTELAALAGDRLRLLAAFPRIGPEAPARSPVSAKLCALPRVIDLAGNGTEVVALITECADTAPLRVATYRWPGPSVAVQTLATPTTLGMQPERLALTARGEVILAGTHAGQLAIGRVVTPGSQVTVTRHLTGVTRLAAAVVADDGGLWTLTLGTASILARDGVVVPLADRAGRSLNPVELAVDATLGILVLAQRGTTHHVLAERAGRRD